MIWVRVVGPESAGKTTLARSLARHFGCRWVPEFAREWLENRPADTAPDLTLADLALIAREQAAREDASAGAGGAMLLCDTDPLATSLWSEVLVGQPLPQLPQREYALTLLLAPATWVPDRVRYQPNLQDRAMFFARCREVYPEATTLDGDWAERFGAAIEAVNAVLRSSLDGR